MTTEIRGLGRAWLLVVAMASCGGEAPSPRAVPCPPISSSATDGGAASLHPPPPVRPNDPSGPPDVTPTLRMVPQLGHSANVRSVRYSPDGTVVFSCGDDRTVKVWDAQTGALLRTLDDHASRVTAVAPLKDGVHLLSGTDKGELDLWDYTTGTRVTQLEAQSDWVADIAVSADGKLALTGNRGQPTVWDLVTGKRLRRLKIPQVVPVVGFTPGGPIAIATRDDAFDVYDLERMTKVKTVEVRLGPLPQRLSPDGTRLAVSMWHGGYDVLVFDTRTWTQKLDLPVQADEAVAAFSGDGELLATASRSGETALWDMRTGQRVRSVQTGQRYFPLPLTAVAVSPDGHRWAVGTSQGANSHVEELDVDSGDATHAYVGTHWSPTSVAIAPGGKTAYVGAEGEAIETLDLETGALGARLPARSGSIYDLAISGDGTRLVEGNDGRVRLWDLPRRSHRDVREYTGIVHDVSISADGRRVACAAADRSARVYDFDTGAEVAHLGAQVWTEGGWVPALELTHDGKALVWAWQSPHSADAGHPSLRLTDVQTRATLREFEGVGAISHIRMAPDGEHFVTVGARLLLWSLTSPKPLATLAEGRAGTGGLAFLPGGDRILAATGAGELTLFDLRTRQAERTYRAAAGAMTSVDVTSDGAHAVSTSRDGSARIWNLQTGASAGFVASGDDWLIFTDDGYFDASRRGGSLVAVVDGMHAYGADQVAARNNRPDLVLERLGLGSPALIEHFAGRHRRRLERLGLGERASASPFEGAPSVRIVDVETAARGKATVTFEATAHGPPLASYHVFVGEVPTLGPAGSPMSGPQQRATVEVELTPGRNRIEVSARSIDGVESLRDYRIIDDDRKARPDLYVLAFGVSRYRNPAYDLSYAHKDATDLAQVLASMEGRGYGHVYTRLLTDAAVTVEAMRETRARLAQARIDDVLVVLAAGHGMYDEDGEYYFLTHEVDLKHLKETAAPFELIEDLVQDVPPRKKLLLIDACNSGDRDPGTAAAAGPEMAGARGLRSRAVRALVLDSHPLRAARPAEIPDRDRYIYNDLLRRSGAIVYSSSRGDEYSFESDSLQNGMFTSAILRGVTTTEADANHDGQVTLDELRTMVATAVAKETNDAQHPTVDQDNPTVTIGFPIARDAPAKIAGQGNLGLESDDTTAPAAVAAPATCLQETHVPHACGCDLVSKGGRVPYAMVLLLAGAAAWRRNRRIRRGRSPSSREPRM